MVCSSQHRCHKSSQRLNAASSSLWARFLPKWQPSGRSRCINVLFRLPCKLYFPISWIRVRCWLMHYGRYIFQHLFGMTGCTVHYVNSAHMFSPQIGSYLMNCNYFKYFHVLSKWVILEVEVHKQNSSCKNVLWVFRPLSTERLHFSSSSTQVLKETLKFSVNHSALIPFLVLLTNELPVIPLSANFDDRKTSLLGCCPN